MNYQQKYLKYKQKYIELKQTGGYNKCTIDPNSIEGESRESYRESFNLVLELENNNKSQIYNYYSRYITKSQIEQLSTYIGTIESVYLTCTDEILKSKIKNILDIHKSIHLDYRSKYHELNNKKLEKDTEMRQKKSLVQLGGDCTETFKHLWDKFKDISEDKLISEITYYYYLDTFEKIINLISKNINILIKIYTDCDKKNFLSKNRINKLLDKHIQLLSRDTIEYNKLLDQDKLYYNKQLQELIQKTEKNIKIQLQLEEQKTSFKQLKEEQFLFAKEHIEAKRLLDKKRFDSLTPEQQLEETTLDAHCNIIKTEIFNTEKLKSCMIISDIFKNIDDIKTNIDKINFLKYKISELKVYIQSSTIYSKLSDELKADLLEQIQTLLDNFNNLIDAGKIIFDLLEANRLTSSPIIKYDDERIINHILQYNTKISGIIELLKNSDLMFDIFCNYKQLDL
jgi:hypothetical protein